MANSLAGKVAVVTGGSSGIGLAAAKRFAAEGASVFIVGRRQDELDKAVLEIGAAATAVRCDVSDLDDLDRLYAEVTAAQGKIDVVFANAAIRLRPLPGREPHPVRHEGFIPNGLGACLLPTARFFHADRVRKRPIRWAAGDVDAGPVIDAVYPLGEIAAAHCSLERSGGFGKRVSDVGIDERPPLVTASLPRPVPRAAAR